MPLLADTKMLLRGDRGLFKSQIKKLTERFKIDATIIIRSLTQI